MPQEAENNKQSGGASQYGPARETWCAVERRKEEDWCRATRKHFKQHLASTVFNPQGPPPKPDSGAFEPEKNKYREMRHFACANVSQINI